MQFTEEDLIIAYNMGYSDSNCNISHRPIGVVRQIKSIKNLLNEDNTQRSPPIREVLPDKD